MRFFLSMGPEQQIWDLWYNNKYSKTNRAQGLASINYCSPWRCVINKN